MVKPAPTHERRQDIVLGYHAPYARQYTEFAVG
ncbi:element excision factor XisI family protein [Coleofasciculus sp. G2-EDA-02]